MARSALEEIALRWVPGEGPVEIQALAGLVNDSYRVARAGKRYSLRLGAADTADLGLDRGWECRVLCSAAAAGVGPVIRHCDPAKGILVADWVVGRAWTAAEISLPGTIDAMAQLLRRVHALPLPGPARVMSPAAWIAHYAAARFAHDRDSTAWWVDLRQAADARIDLLASFEPFEPVLCHGDLHRPNIVIGDRAILLDWEYAHASDPFWDLAGWIANNDWQQDLADKLLTSYLRRASQTGERARLSVLVWLYDYICLLWSALYLKRTAGHGDRDVAARARRLQTRLKRAAGSRAG